MNNNHGHSDHDAQAGEHVWYATLGPERFDIDPAPLIEAAQVPLEIGVLADHPTYDGQTTLEVSRPDWNPPEPGLVIPVGSAGTQLGDWSGRSLSTAEAAEVLGLPPERVQPLVDRALELYRDSADREQRYDSAVQRMDPGELCRVAGASLCIYEPEFGPNSAQTHLPVSRDGDADPTMSIFLTAPQFRDTTGEPLHLQQAANQLGLPSDKMLDLGYRAASMLRAGQAAYNNRPSRPAALQAGILANPAPTRSPGVRTAQTASHHPSTRAALAPGL